MQLQPDYHDCFAERAEVMESKPDEKTGKTSLMVRMTYRFPSTGETLDHYHILVKKDGTLNVDRSGVSEVSKLEQRYGVDLSNFEFDNNKLSPDIIVRAKVEEETREYKGKTYKDLRIARIYDNGRKESQPVDKAALGRRFGSILRAAHSSNRAPTVSKPSTAPSKGPGKAGAPTPPPPAAKAPPAAPTASDGGISSAQECWAIFCELPDFKHMSEGNRGEAWWKMLDETFGHRQQERLSPQEWGAMKEKLEGMEQIPF